MDFSALTLVFMTALFDMVPAFWPTKPPVPLWLELIFEFITLQFSMLPRFLLASMRIFRAFSTYACVFYG